MRYPSILSLIFFVAAMAIVGRAQSLSEQIDGKIDSAFGRWNAKPAERSSDDEFLRRVYLDLTGMIPTAEQTRSFLSSTDSDKRTKLVDQLLASDDFAKHMATVFDVMLMERRPDKYVTTDEWRTYLAKSFAENKPLNILVAEILGSDGVDEVKRPAAKFFLDRAVDKDVLVRDIGRLFLGVDLQCAQCHDHPSIEGYLHQHYHGLSVFVAGSKTFRQPDGKFVLQEMVTREIEFASVFEPDDLKKTGPRLLNVAVEVPEVVEGEEYVEKPSRTVRAVPKFSLRKLLAEKLPSNQMPEFSRNMANRLWAMMMGRGLVHPLDMHHAANEPSHPELLELLTAHFAKSNFDTKLFLREIALSKAYGRSSIVPSDVELNRVPPESFAVANMKGLSPEQLFASLLLATHSEKRFEAQIETALKEDEEAYQELVADEKKLAEARVAKRSERIKEFVSLFGSVPGRPKGDFQASLPQALFFANSETVVSWIEAGDGNLTETLLANDEPRKVIEQIYLNVLSRFPHDDEFKAGVQHLANCQDDRPRGVMELMWSLIASAEFRLNH